MTPPSGNTSALYAMKRARDSLAIVWRESISKARVSKETKDRFREFFDEAKYFQDEMAAGRL